MSYINELEWPNTRRVREVEDEILVIGPDDEPRMISLRNEKRYRICQKCTRVIYYDEYIRANLTKHWKNVVECDGICLRDPKLDLKQIWESKYIQLLCCKCMADAELLRECDRLELKYGFEQ